MKRNTLGSVPRESSVDSTLVNPAPREAARYSSNPYIRAGILAVSTSHPLSGRRSSSREASPSASMVPSAALHVWPTPATQPIEAKQQAAHSSLAQERSVDVVDAADARSTPAEARAARPSRRRVIPLATVTPTSLDDTVTTSPEGSNVYISHETVLEYSSPTHDPGLVGGSSHPRGRSTQRSSSQTAAAPPLEVALAKQHVSKDLFVAIMGGFLKQVGTLTPQMDYFSPLEQGGVWRFATPEQEQPVTNSVQRHASHPPAIENSRTLGVRSDEEKQGRSAPAVVFQVSPVRHHRLVPPSHGEVAPATLQLLLNQTFTCQHCKASHMRGTQCSSCGNPLPWIRTCTFCNAVTRGTFCGHCGKREQC